MIGLPIVELNAHRKRKDIYSARDKGFCHHNVYDYTIVLRPKYFFNIVFTISPNNADIFRSLSAYSHHSKICIEV